MSENSGGKYSGEQDALESLSASLARVVQTAQTAGLAETPPRGEVPKLSLPGLAFTGKSPNILSKEARYRLINFLLWAAALIFGCTIISSIYLAFVTKAEIPSTWVWIVGVSVIVALFLCVLAYFTVMGFGEVSLSLNSEAANSGGTDGSDPGTGGVAPPATPTPAQEKLP